MKHVYFLLLPVLLFGCAMSASIYKSGIKFEGDNVKKENFGYQVILDDKNRIELTAGCSQYVEQAGMASFLVPLPPVIPVGSKEKESRALDFFTITITSWNGKKLSVEDMKMTASVGKEFFQLKLLEQDVNSSAEVITYKFGSTATCGSIKNGTFEIKWMDEKSLKYKINFYEGTQWETYYLSS